MQQVVSRKEAKEKGLKHYFTGKHCKHGHVAERRVSNSGCCVCLAEALYKYQEQNRERITEYDRKRYEEKKEIILEGQRKYRKENKEKISERNRKYHKANPEQAFIRRSLNRCMDNFAGKRAKAEELLGYTSEHLKQHIESQFEEGMSWENHSLTGWHIDHIKPVSVFIKEGITDPAIINALDNLQPLWAHENWSKSDKMVMEKSNEN